MSELRTIEIDFDVHRRIELERRGFSEPPNLALRRLLGIDTGDTSSPPKAMPQAGRSWSGKGVTLPHGTELRMEYNGRVYAGRIENGNWAVEGREFRSPSAAAGGVARTKEGRLTQLDGWIYWEAKRPGESQWVKINSLRRT
jgi:hypothetical protein